MKTESLSTDLVSILRAAADGNYNYGGISELFKQAADEIVRLRSALANIHSGVPTDPWHCAGEALGLVHRPVAPDGAAQPSPVVITEIKR